MSIGWNDVEALARGLHAAHSDVDPLSVGFVELQRWAAALEEFGGDPQQVSPETLEAIQQAWHAIYREGQAH